MQAVVEGPRSEASSCLQPDLKEVVGHVKTWLAPPPPKKLVWSVTETEN